MTTVLRFEALGVVVALFLAACDRGTPERSVTEKKPAAAASAAPAAPAPVIDSVAARFGDTKRIVAIGDVHGDLDGLRRALRLAGAIDVEDDWIGGELVVVQTGDQLDRGDQERGILDLLAKLEEQAAKAGGALHVLNGNHEVMNVQGDFRYVTPGGFSEFRDVTGGSPDVTRMPSVAQGRAAAFFPRGRYAKQLGARNTVVTVGDTVFAHGGVLPKHVEYGITRLNSEVRAWMNGTRAEPPAVVVAEDGPIWTRFYSEPETAEAHCQVLRRTLDMMRADRLVVGHTTQKDGITSACDGKVWRIDVGIARYYGSRIEALELVRKETLVEHAGTKIPKADTRIGILREKAR